MLTSSGQSPQEEHRPTRAYNLEAEAQRRCSATAPLRSLLSGGQRCASKRTRPLRHPALELQKCKGRRGRNQGRSYPAFVSTARLVTSECQYYGGRYLFVTGEPRTKGLHRIWHRPRRVKCRNRNLIDQESRKNVDCRSTDQIAENYRRKAASAQLTGNRSLNRVDARATSSTMRTPLISTFICCAGIPRRIDVLVASRRPSP